MTTTKNAVAMKQRGISMTEAFALRMQIADAQGDISDMLNEGALATLGADVVEDYDRDLVDRERWSKKAEKAVKAAAQEEKQPKDTPWPNASNVKYPLLTVAALQFNARAYPAIVKGDEAVSIKIIGRDNGRPNMLATPQGPIPVPMLKQQMGEQLPHEIAAMPDWAVEPGAKKQRASRVKEYMNAHLFYRMEDWEQDTDQLLMMLPIVGCMFRKVTSRDGKHRVRLVSGLKLVAPMWAVDCETAPRLTEIIDNLATYQVRRKMMAGEYRVVDLGQDEDAEKPRIILEQHRFVDLDGDGGAEPYIVTVDYETRSVLRIEPNFSRQEALKEKIEKASVYYVKYDFLPNPNGEFYGFGFGHLTEEIAEVVNTLINQMIDAGTAQNAGGGFIASGIRLQSKGSGSVRWRPGEYKVVDVSGDQLRSGLVERTFPNVSPVSFQLLDIMLSAAKDISSVKDVITGDASNNGQVGTTLALIEQGLAQFTAVYKRVYRSLKKEFQLLFDCMAKWPGDDAQQEYVELLDDPMADYMKDFNMSDMDIRPVSDPTSVTKQQKIARAEFLMSFRGQGLDDMEINRRALEAADVEDIDGLMPKEKGPDPLMMTEVENKQADTAKKVADARLSDAKVQQIEADTFVSGITMGAKNGPDFGGISSMAG